MTRNMEIKLALLSQYGVSVGYTDDKIYVYYYLNTGLELKCFRTDITHDTLKQVICLCESIRK